MDVDTLAEAKKLFVGYVIELENLCFRFLKDGVKPSVHGGVLGFAGWEPLFVLPRGANGPATMVDRARFRHDLGLRSWRWLGGDRDGREGNTDRHMQILDVVLHRCMCRFSYVFKCLHALVKQHGLVIVEIGAHVCLSNRDL